MKSVSKKQVNLFSSNLNDSHLNEGMMFQSRLNLVSAKNEFIHLAGSDGKAHKYIDMMSAYGSVNFGHLNPKINPYQKLKADIAACFVPKESELWANWICTKLDVQSTHRVLSQVGGSFAVSTALSMCLNSRPGKILAVKGSFHGLGLDSLAVTDIHKEFAIQNNRWLKLIENNVTFVEPGTFISDWSGVSAFIYEPVQGANGYVPLEPIWLLEMQRRAQNAGAYTIADEIQSGFFRHGHLSVAKNYGLTPDIFLFGKSLTNGLFPMSAVVYNGHLEGIWTQPIILSHTHQTNCLGQYAAWSVARYLDTTDIKEKVRRVHDRFSEFTDELRGNENIKKIHLSGPTLSFEVTNGRAKQIVLKIFEKGVMFFTGGRNGERFRMAPPITISSKSLEIALNEFYREIKKLK